MTAPTPVPEIPQMTERHAKYLAEAKSLAWHAGDESDSPPCALPSCEHLLKSSPSSALSPKERFAPWTMKYLWRSPNSGKRNFLLTRGSEGLNVSRRTRFLSENPSRELRPQR